MKRWPNTLTASERKHLRQTYEHIPPMYNILIDQRKTRTPCEACRALLARQGVTL